MFDELYNLYCRHRGPCPNHPQNPITVINVNGSNHAWKMLHYQAKYLFFRLLGPNISLENFYHSHYLPDLFGSKVPSARTQDVIFEGACFIFTGLMGLRIIITSSETILIQPFTRTQLKQRTVQLWCNTKTQEHNLVYRKAVSVNRGTKFKPEVIIEFSVPSFRSLVNTGAADWVAFAKKMNRGRSLVLSTVNLPIDGEMLQGIYRIVQHNKADPTRLLFLQVRAIELLLLHQQSYIRTNTPKPVYVKNDYDKERIVFARDYLLTHMDAPPSLQQLAAIAGINEFKLKRGFKELFNQPVFEYLAGVRLEMARRALVQKEKNVTQIAFELGYASLQHFSTAFKKKFGVSPAKFR